MSRHTRVNLPHMVTCIGFVEGMGRRDQSNCCCYRHTTTEQHGSPTQRVGQHLRRIAVNYNVRSRTSRFVNSASMVNKNAMYTTSHKTCLLNSSSSSSRDSSRSTQSTFSSHFLPQPNFSSLLEIHEALLATIERRTAREERRDKKDLLCTVQVRNIFSRESTFCQ